MPRFFIDTYDGCTTLLDSYGIELTSVEEAVHEAASLLPEFARETIPDGQAHRFATAVRDASDSVVYRAMLLFRDELGESLDSSEPKRLQIVEDEIITSRRLRQEMRVMRPILRRCTDELAAARLEARTSREASEGGRQGRSA